MVNLRFNYGTSLTPELVQGENPQQSLVGVIMGSASDWETVEPCCAMLDELKIRFEYGVVSAHRTPGRMVTYAQKARARGLHVIIACAGGSAHLPGMTASETTLPVLGFGPLSKAFGPMDVIGSNVRMPKGIPLAFMGLDAAGAVNAALLAARILSLGNAEIEERVVSYFGKQTNDVPYSAHE